MPNKETPTFVPVNFRWNQVETVGIREKLMSLKDLLNETRNPKEKKKP